MFILKDCSNRKLKPFKLFSTKEFFINSLEEDMIKFRPFHNLRANCCD